MHFHGKIIRGVEVVAADVEGDMEVQPTPGRLKLWLGTFTGSALAELNPEEYTLVLHDGRSLQIEVEGAALSGHNASGSWNFTASGPLR